MKQNENNGKINKILLITVIIESVLLVALLIYAGFLTFGQQPEETVPTSEPTVPPTTQAPTTVPTTVPEETTEPTEPCEQVLELREINEENPDIDAWIEIGDTVIDYPIAYTPDEPDKYDRMDIDGHYSYHGTLYIGKQCSMDPESDNLIIYGHNLENGRMFSNLFLYKDEDYWKDHSLITFHTVNGTRTYKVLAAFYDRLYYSYEDEFEFYKFVDAKDEADYNNAIAAFKDKALYDTGVDASYGDKLLTLVTCSYHHMHGRFVVVAVETETPPPAPTPTDPVE